MKTVSRGLSILIATLALSDVVSGQAVTGPAIPIPPPPPANVTDVAPDVPSLPVAEVEDPAELERVAVEAIRAGDAATGEAALRKLLSIRPGEREAVLALGTLLLRSDPHAAMVLLNEHAPGFPGDVEVQLLFTEALSANGRVCEAISRLERLRCADACSPDVDAALGRAYLKTQRPILGRSFLQCGNDSSPEAAQRRRLALGSAAAQLGVQSEARCYFEEVACSPSSIDVGSEARRLEQELDRAIYCPSRFYGSLKITERYDDFPGVVPTANLFGGPVARTNSFGNLATASLNYDLIRVDDATVTAGYDGLYSHYYEPSSSRYDVLDHAGYVAATRRGFTPWRDLPFSATLRGDYDNVSADQDPFLQRYGANWNLTVQDSDYTSTSAIARYTQYDFLNAPTTFLPGFLFAVPGDADSDNYGLGVTRQWQTYDRILTYQAGYFFDRNVADSPQFTYTGHKLVGGVSAKMPACATAAVNLSYQRRDYDASTGAYRADDELLVGVRYIVPLWRDDVSMIAEYAYDLNQSTLAATSYDRNVFDLGVIWNFGR